MINETATLLVSTCTRCKLITYALDSSNLIQETMHVTSCGRKGRVPQFSMIVETAILHASTCTRSRLITYTLDSLDKFNQWNNACGRKSSTTVLSDH